MPRKLRLKRRESKESLREKREKGRLKN